MRAFIKTFKKSDLQCSNTRQFKSSRSTGEIWLREDFSSAVNRQSVVALGLMTYPACKVIYGWVIFKVILGKRLFADHVQAKNKAERQTIIATKHSVRRNYFA